MDRAASIALGLGLLVVGALAVGSEGGGRATPPSTARRATASRDGVVVRESPNLTTAPTGTLPRGPEVLVGDETSAVNGFLPLVREWVEADGSRFSREIGWVPIGDLTILPPPVAMARIGQAPPEPPVHGGECPIDPWRVVVWGSDVDRFKARIDPYFEAADASVRACASFPAAERPGWDAFIAGWRAVRARTAATYVAARTELQNVCQYANDLTAWRARIRQFCPLLGPEPPALPAEKPSPLAEAADLARWVAIAGGVIGGGILLLTFAPEIKMILPGRHSQ